MKTILTTFISAILISYLPIKCIAQENFNRKTFISIHSGTYLPSMKDFNKVYNSPFAFINGISLGIPFTNKAIFLYGKAMYFQKSGTPIIYHFDSNNGINTIYTTQEGDIVLQQLLVNIGMQYNLSLKTSNTIVLNGGISFVNSSEKVINSFTNSKSKGFAGYFLGIGYEKRLSDQFSWFSEAQYNFDRVVFKMLDMNYEGTNINIGIRYYFNQL